MTTERSLKILNQVVLVVSNKSPGPGYRRGRFSRFAELSIALTLSEALAPRHLLRVLNLCDTSATPLCLWVPHLHKLFASKRFCSSSSSPELCLHRLYALPSDLRLRSMPLLNLLGEPAGSSSASP
ncbi:hypothetical protein YC2023_082091 [Brassica napus]